MSSDAQKALAVWAKAALNGKRGAQARLARELNLSPEKISRSLNGERELSFWEVVAIAKMFDKVPPGLEDFLGGNPQASPRVESRLEEIERKIDALARHLGASEGRSASAAEAKRRVSERKATLPAAKPRGPASDSSLQERRKSKSEDPPSGSGDRELN